MSGFDRYQITTKTIHSMGESWDESQMTKSKYGGYVKYDDVIQRIAELEAQLPKWISVEDGLPEWGVIVLVFIPERDGEDAYVTMDCMDEDFEYWQLISEDYDHAQAVGRVTDSDKMPSGVAPYTHWMPLQQPPKEVA